VSVVAWEILFTLLLVGLNGFLAMSELAIVSSRRTRLQRMILDGRRGARRALALVDDPGNFLSTVQMGITLIGILAGAFSGATISAQLAAALKPIASIGDAAEPLAIGIVVVVVTYVSLIAGELVPKRLALNNAETIAIFVARPMTILVQLGRPVVWILRVSTEIVLRLIGVPMRRPSTVTEDEVKALIAEGAEAGVFAAAEHLMLNGVMRLADRPVRAIMTPRLDVVWLDPADDVESIRQRIYDSGHSRFPVSRRGIDAIEGIVHTKDLLDRLLSGEPFDIAAAMRATLSVHEHAPVLRLIELFRHTSIHLALVVDEYGTFEGVVTPADILKAITGEVGEGDEVDEQRIVRRDDGSWLIDGMVPIDEVERLLERPGMKTEEHDFHTLAGFVLWQVGHVPQVGENFAWADLRIEVVDMDGRRIDRVLIAPLAARHPCSE
jgi:Hemolysins and related proteins containing CBS domains